MDIIGAGDTVILNDDIMKMANLAKLEIKEDEVSFYVDEMQKMLDFAEKIDRVEDVENIGKTEVLDYNNMREDVVQDSFDNSEILSNAQDTDDVFFRLRKRV